MAPSFVLRSDELREIADLVDTVYANRPPDPFSVSVFHHTVQGVVYQMTAGYDPVGRFGLSSVRLAGR